MHSGADLHTLVVVPTYNERENVGPLCRDLLALGEGIEVLVVDDNSPDGTWRAAARLSRRQPRVHLLRRRGKLGLGTAHVAGYRWALRRDYERVITMDADFSHPPGCIPEMLRMSRACHLVLGSRYAGGGGHRDWPLRRVLLSTVSNWVARTLLRLEPRDCTGAFRCFHRRALEAVPLRNIRARGYAFQEEMLWQCSGPGWKVGEVPIMFAQRARGSSKMGWGEVLGAIWTVLRLTFTPERQRRPAPPLREGDG